jgi:solute carrier family 25 phosphate transporter 23/24/25/41
MFVHAPRGAWHRNHGRLIADHMQETTGSRELTPVLRLTAGAGAGIVAMSATYPLDMVRGRLTVQEGRNVQYNGIVHASRTILREVSNTN